MKILLLTFSFLFLFAVQNTNAQIDKNVLIKSKGKYYYQDRFYKKKELGKLFKLNEPSLKYFNKHRKAQNVFIVSGISTLLLGGGGLILFNDNNGGNHSEGDKCYEFCPHQEVGIVMILASWATAAATIISYPIARRNFKKSINSFHEYTDAKNKLGSRPLQLNLNYTGTGVGLVLNF